MWFPIRQLQQVCAPLLQATLKLGASQTPILLNRSLHILSVSALRKTLSLLPQHRIASPLSVDQYTDGMLCNPSSLPIPSTVQPSCGFKLKRVLKRRCKDCYFVVREDRLHVICKTHPRHKQMAIKSKEKSTWILTHAMQSPVRPY